MTQCAFVLKTQVTRDDTRRRTIKLTDRDTFTFAQFCELLPPEIDLNNIKWKDSDGHMISIKNDDDLDEAMDNMDPSVDGKPVLKIFVEGSWILAATSATEDASANCFLDSPQSSEVAMFVDVPGEEGSGTEVAEISEDGSPVCLNDCGSCQTPTKMPVADGGAMDHSSFGLEQECDSDEMDDGANNDDGSTKWQQLTDDGHLQDCSAEVRKRCIWDLFFKTEKPSEPAVAVAAQQLDQLEASAPRLPGRPKSASGKRNKNNSQSSSEVDPAAVGPTAVSSETKLAQERADRLLRRQLNQILMEVAKEIRAVPPRCSKPRVVRAKTWLVPVSDDTLVVQASEPTQPTGDCSKQDDGLAEPATVDVAMQTSPQETHAAHRNRHAIDLPDSMLPLKKRRLSRSFSEISQQSSPLSNVAASELAADMETTQNTPVPVLERDSVGRTISTDSYPEHSPSTPLYDSAFSDLQLDVVTQCKLSTDSRLMNAPLLLPGTPLPFQHGKAPFVEGILPKNPLGLNQRSNATTHSVLDSVEAAINAILAPPTVVAQPEPERNLYPSLFHCSHPALVSDKRSAHSGIQAVPAIPPASPNEPTAASNDLPWSPYENAVLLQAYQKFEQLSNGHAKSAVINWDFISSLFHANSFVRRSSEDCRRRFEQLSELRSASGSFGSLAVVSSRGACAMISDRCDALSAAALRRKESQLKRQGSLPLNMEDSIKKSTAKDREEMMVKNGIGPFAYMNPAEITERRKALLNRPPSPFLPPVPESSPLRFDPLLQCGQRSEFAPSKSVVLLPSLASVRSSSTLGNVSTMQQCSVPNPFLYRVNPGLRYPVNVLLYPNGIIPLPRTLHLQTRMNAPQSPLSSDSMPVYAFWN